MYFHYFVIISPWKRMALHFNKSESPTTEGALCQVCKKLAHWFWRKRRKVYNDIDNGQIVIEKKTHSILLLRWAKNDHVKNPLYLWGSLIVQSYQFTFCYAFHCIPPGGPTLSFQWTSSQNIRIVGLFLYWII